MHWNAPYRDTLTWPPAMWPHCTVKLPWLPWDMGFHCARKPPAHPCYWHLVVKTGYLFKLIHLRTSLPCWHLVVIAARTVGTSGQYVSYWNAFLLMTSFCLLVASSCCDQNHEWDRVHAHMTLVPLPDAKNAISGSLILPILWLWSSCLLGNNSEIRSRQNKTCVKSEGISQFTDVKRIVSLTAFMLWMRQFLLFYIGFELLTKKQCRVHRPGKVSRDKNLTFPVSGLYVELCTTLLALDRQRSHVTLVGKKTKIRPVDISAFNYAI